jgi:hypothetical protein
MTDIDNVADKTDNVAGDGVDGGMPDCPDNVANWVRKYRKKNKTINVAVRLDPRTYRLLNKMAESDDCEVNELINEALIVWVKWLYKANKEELREGGMIEGRRMSERWYDNVRDYVEAKDIHRAISAENWMKGNEKRRERVKRAMKSRRSWELMYPGKPYPVEKVRERA